MNQLETPKPGPPGQIKIEEAVRKLLEEKDFNSITTAEISRTSGVNEALIYRYFKDKRGLLHHVLACDLDELVSNITAEISGIESSFDKLRNLIRIHIQYYNQNRIFAKILLLEVRNFPAYFESEAYRIVQSYGRMIQNLIENGTAEGEIRSDIPPSQIMRIILGGLEHLCLPGVIFGKEIRAEEYAQNLCAVISNGISKQ